MHVTNRPFELSGSDFENMWRLLQQDYAHKQDRFIWLFSRLGEWKYGLWRERKYIPSFFQDHAQLWVDDFDQLLGFVLSEDGENIFFILTLPGYDYLYADILDWTIRNWGPRYAALKTEVHEYQVEALKLLENSGFRSLGAAATTHQYDLLAKRDAAVNLAAGYRIVDLGENGDYHAKALLNVNANDNRNQVSEFDLLRFAYSRRNPAYDPAFDLSVITEEGLHIASCVGFKDPAYRVAEIEKVCTHQQFRRQGLAEAVIRACFQRLAAIGIETAYITGYSGEANGLYEKLGPCKHKQWFLYELME